MLTFLLRRRRRRSLRVAAVNLWKQRNDLIQILIPHQRRLHGSRLLFWAPMGSHAARAIQSWHLAQRFVQHRGHRQILRQPLFHRKMTAPLMSKSWAVLHGRFCIQLRRTIQTSLVTYSAGRCVLC